MFSLEWRQEKLAPVIHSIYDFLADNRMSITKGPPINFAEKTKYHEQTSPKLNNRKDYTSVIYLDA